MSGTATEQNTMTNSASRRSDNVEESGQDSTYPPAAPNKEHHNGHEQHHVKMASGTGKKEKQSSKINGDDPKKTDKKPSKLHAFVKKQLTLPEWVKNNYKQWKVSFIMTDLPCSEARAESRILTCWHICISELESRHSMRYRKLGRPGSSDGPAYRAVYRECSLVS